MTQEIDTDKHLELKPAEEYSILAELLQKYKKDLVNWRLKLGMSERHKARMSLTGEDMVAGKKRQEMSPADMVEMAIGKTKSEILLCEETIEDIRDRMAEVYEKLSEKERKKLA